MFLKPPKPGQVPGKVVAKRKHVEPKAFEAKRVRVFLHKWTDEFAWVRHDEEKNEMFCAACRDFPNKADW